MIIKRVDLKKLKINGAVCKFDKAELIITMEEIELESYTDKIFEWDIEVNGAKCHVDFDEFLQHCIDADLNFETIDGDIAKAKGRIIGTLVSGSNYEEISIRVNGWEVAV